MNENNNEKQENINNIDEVSINNVISTEPVVDTSKRNNKIVIVIIIFIIVVIIGGVFVYRNISYKENSIDDDNNKNEDVVNKSTEDNKSEETPTTKTLDDKKEDINSTNIKQGQIKEISTDSNFKSYTLIVNENIYESDNVYEFKLNDNRVITIKIKDNDLYLNVNDNIVIDGWNVYYTFDDETNTTRDAYGDDVKDFKMRFFAYGEYLVFETYDELSDPEIYIVDPNNKPNKVGGREVSFSKDGITLSYYSIIQS